MLGLGRLMFALFVAAALLGLAELWVSPLATETFVKIEITLGVVFVVLAAAMFLMREKRESDKLRQDKSLR
jgi:Mn2+/Fe2+ NRAMP family transporter